MDAQKKLIKVIKELLTLEELGENFEEKLDDALYANRLAVLTHEEWEKELTANYERGMYETKDEMWHEREETDERRERMKRAAILYATINKYLGDGDEVALKKVFDINSKIEDEYKERGWNEY